MRCITVVPIYKTQPSKSELLSLLRLRQLGIANVVFIGPLDLDITQYLQYCPELKIERFENHYFSGIPGYNELMLSTKLYERFSSNFEWMLIYQLDAFLFSNKIEEFCKLPFDYYGAPWKNGQLMFPGIRNAKFLKFIGKRVYVGNGGLSLRKLSTTIDLLKRKRNNIYNWKLNEDGFFSYWGCTDKNYRSCPIEIASRFAIETDPKYWISKNGFLAMGCHAFEKCSPEFYTSLLEPFFLELEHLLPQSEQP